MIFPGCVPPQTLKLSTSGCKFRKELHRLSWQDHPTLGVAKVDTRVMKTKSSLARKEKEKINKEEVRGGNSSIVIEKKKSRFPPIVLNHLP